MSVTIQNRYMRNRIYRMKQYNMLEQAPISVADFNALAVATVKVLNSYETPMLYTLQQHHKYIQHGSFVNLMHTCSSTAWRVYEPLSE